MPFNRSEYNKSYYEKNKEKFKTIYYKKDKQVETNKANVEKKTSKLQNEVNYYKDLCDKFMNLLDCKDDPQQLQQSFNNIEIPVRDMSRYYKKKHNDFNKAVETTYLFRDDQN